MIKKLIFAGVGMTQMPASERDSLMQALGKLEDANEQHREMLSSLADKGQKQAEKFADNVMTTFNDLTEKFQNLLLTSIEPFERTERIEGITRQVDELANRMRGWVTPGSDQATGAAAPKKKAKSRSKSKTKG